MSGIFSCSFEVFMHAGVCDVCVHLCVWLFGVCHGMNTEARG